MFTSNPFESEHVGRQITLRQAHPLIAIKHDVGRLCRKAWRLFEKGNPLTNPVSAVVTVILLVGSFVALWEMNANVSTFLADAGGWVCLGFAAFVNAAPPIDGCGRKP
jgi:hypothetical protein